MAPLKDTVFGESHQIYFARCILNIVNVDQMDLPNLPVLSTPKVIPLCLKRVRKCHLLTVRFSTEHQILYVCDTSVVKLVEKQVSRSEAWAPRCVGCWAVRCAMLPFLTSHTVFLFFLHPMLQKGCVCVPWKRLKDRRAYELVKPEKMQPYLH